MNDHKKRPDEIERDIEQTRADLAATIDAIQQKLTPGQMMDQALGYLRTSLPAEFGHNLADAIKRNPLPVALIGAGIAWAALAARQDHSARFASSLEPLGIDPAHQAGDDKRTGEGLRQTVRSARESLHRAGDRSRESLHRIADRSQDSYDRVRSTLADLVDEQPLMMGALGLALGGALGALLPRTDREDELMGEQRDELMDSATDAARDVAERAVESARDAAGQAAGSIHAAVEGTGSRPVRAAERPGTPVTASMHATAGDDRARTPPARPAGFDSPFRGEPGDGPGRG
jgi:hypothetical protein